MFYSDRSAGWRNRLETENSCWLHTAAASRLGMDADVLALSTSGNIEYCCGFVEHGVILEIVDVNGLNEILQ